ncbi:G patch domain-containing protein 8-like isoform X2 [Anabas testudineus]|uniref:G patch domain-containing protein 8-like isoform X2 n=1 Tax=Anabas testudineus TaxID=64144 RepID=UPI000E463AB1|nr:G patch domain-containing protein 8-like isoform X2 [Anabas testudineus]
MTRVGNSLNVTQSDAIAEAISAESCHIVLETSPPDYVQKISRYLESSGGQSRQDKASTNPAEADSDSGDSLFLTQKSVPEAVRTGKRHRYSLRSTPTSPRDEEESEDDKSCSPSHGESANEKKRKRKKCHLPKYHFPFLNKKNWNSRSTLLSLQQNARLHDATMGGFFKCVRELWQGYERGDMELSLPTLDIDGDCISPLTEEERSEDEDIKVVEKKRFVAPSKTKRSQPWYTPPKRDNHEKQQRKGRRRWTPSNASKEERQMKAPKNKSTKVPMSMVTLSSSDTESSDGGPCRVQAERETNAKCATSGTTFAETPRTKGSLTRGKKRIIFQEKESEEELCEDSDATICQPQQLQGSPRELGGGREAAVTVAEAQADVYQTDHLSETGREEDEPESQSLLQNLPELVSDTNNDSVCNETTVKKKKKKKKVKGEQASVEEGKGQSEDEPECLHASASANVDAEETLSPPEDNTTEPLKRRKACVELELKEKCMENPAHEDNILEQEERDFPDSAPTKKKRKKGKSTADSVGQEVGDNIESGARLEDSGVSMTDKEKKKKKKKKKRMKGSVEDDEQLESSPVAEPLNDPPEPRKKKKKKKEKTIAITEEREEEVSENTLVPQDSLGCSYEKKRRKQKSKKRSSSVDDSQVGEEDGVNVSLTNVSVALEENIGLSVKKKKKKKKSEPVSEEVDISSTPDKNRENTDKSQKTTDGLEEQGAEQVTEKKKKKREKTGEITSTQVSEDIAAQSVDPAPLRKKKKKKKKMSTSSFLDADSEEKVAQSHQQQKSSSKSGAETASGGGDAESAEIALNSGDGVSKKKKKRKRRTSATQENVEEDHEPHFEGPKETCESAFTDKKRKKKCPPMERLDGAAHEGQSQTDEAVVLKKKKKKKSSESPPAASEEAEPRRAKRKKSSKRFNSPLGAN